MSGDHTHGEDDWLQLGTLTAPWGTRGEIKLRLDADPAVLKKVTRVYLGAERRPIDVERVAQRGRFHTLKLRGIETVNDAETLRDAVAAIPRSEAPPLPSGHYYVAEILGLQAVTTDGRALGPVVDVLTTGANDVYVVRGERGEILIPAIREVVVALDPAAGILRVEAVPGLLDNA